MPGGRYFADALRRRLARQEADGDTDGAKATKKRLAAVEKAEKAEPEVEAVPAESKTTAKEK